MPPNKALHLTSHSPFQSASGRVWHRNLGASGEPQRRCGSQLSAMSVGLRESGVGRHASDPREEFSADPERVRSRLQLGANFSGQRKVNRALDFLSPRCS